MANPPIEVFDPGKPLIEMDRVIIPGNFGKMGYILFCEGAGYGKRVSDSQSLYGFLADVGHGH
jgi:hypothetical protein